MSDRNIVTMKLFVLLVLCLTIALALADGELQLAEECDVEACQLPDCRCSNVEIPGGLEARDTPQFVIVSFNDGINVVNIGTFRSILFNRQNTNGCPARATFFIRHEYTNYALVNELYNTGFEIGLNSITWRFPQTWWATATLEELKQEIADQRIQMAHFANIPYDEITGVRLPFLQMSGNTSFQVIADSGLKYDYSWATLDYKNPGLWPYSLDYASIQDCVNLPCPTASISKAWVNPIVTWTDLNGFSCATLDGCIFVPALTDEEGWFQFIVGNFERHYFGNRAPFTFALSEGYLVHPSVRAAVIRFFDLINNMQDAFMVSASDVLDWVKNPVPIDEYKSQACKTFTATECQATTCPLVAEHNQMAYWLQICNVCPNTYPWLGNPLCLL